jgi:NAD(P) transhydrogenase subunit alpha
MIVGVPRDIRADERRVALTPEAVGQLGRAGLTIQIERDAGTSSGYPDAQFEAKGATVAPSRAALFEAADVIAQVNTYGALPHGNGAGAAAEAAAAADLALLRSGQTVIGMSGALTAPDRIATMAGRGATVFGLELMPRITRAQSMDALSSMATLAGYKAVLIAAERLPRCFPMFMTAAGTVRPARVFVIGAGVAGLQAIATAKRLGAVVSAYDVRPEVKEQVESVGGKFVELPLETAGMSGANGYAEARDESFYARQRELMGRVVRGSDVVITTAAVPGRAAPRLVTAEMMVGMEPGSVVVDLAAESGGNCELTRAGEEYVTPDGVLIVGPVNVASSVPYHASQLYGRNVSTFLLHLVRDKALNIDPADEITAGTLLCRGGDVVHPRLRQALSLPPLGA